MKEFYKKCEEEVIYLNKFITNNRINKINNYEYKEIKNKNGLIDVFEIVNDYINELTKNIKEDKSNKNKLNNIVKEEKNKEGFYPYSSSTPEIDTIRIFLYLTNNLPTPQNVLICSENTTNEEICSFLYRAFYDEEKRLYIMINSEKLNLDKTNKLISLLKELKLKTDDQMKSVLIFINKKDTSDFSEQIRELNNKQNIELQEMRTKIDIIPKITNNNTEIIYSFKPGVGKSNYIKNNFIKNNKNYSYFPIGGDLNLEELLNRLKYQIKRGNVGLHIDILDTDSEDILEIVNQFLFSFLVMNYFSFNGNICYIRNDEIDIKVEIPSSLIDNFIKFPILNYFNKKGIYKVSIEKYNIYNKEEVLKAKENI